MWKRHNLYSRTGVYDAIHQHVMALKDAEGNIDWALSVDGKISRAHQHATNTPRPDQHTGGLVQITRIPRRCVMNLQITL